MIKCKYCKAENSSDDKFCQGCGRDIRTAVSAPSQKKKLSSAKIFGRIILFFLLLLAFFITYFLVYPSFHLRKLPKITNGELLNGEKKLRSIEFMKKGKYTFSTDAITLLYNTYYNPKATKTKPLFVSVNKKKKLCFTIRIRFLKQIKLGTPVTVTVMPTYSFTRDNRRVSGFHPVYITVGNLPVPKYMYSKILPYFSEYYNSRTKKFLKNIFDIHVNKDNTVTFTVNVKKETYF
ncbi:MAG: hypothetical protein K9M56_08565 [Victivallales bacterium]|nr:hypothetical protein [Victivallales bacterium]